MIDEDGKHVAEITLDGGARYDTAMWCAIDARGISRDIAEYHPDLDNKIDAYSFTYYANGSKKYSALLDNVTKGDFESIEVMDSSAQNSVVITNQNINEYHAEQTRIAEAAQQVVKEQAIAEQQALLSRMLNDLKSNALKAESTYQDQYVELSGKLTIIDSDGKYISIVPVNDEFSFDGVLCNIKNEEQKQKVMEMNIGDTITVKGKITSVGELLGYQLDIESLG